MKSSPAKEPNPYRSPGNDDVPAVPSNVERPNTAWRAFHPLNIVLLIGLVCLALIGATEGKLVATVLVGGAIFLGAVSWFVNVRVLTSRWTISVINLGLVNLMVFATALASGTRGLSAAMGALVDTNTLIMGGVRFGSASAPIIFISGCILAVWAMILSPVIRPNIRTALLSAVGTGIWYSLSILIGAHAG